MPMYDVWDEHPFTHTFTHDVQGTVSFTHTPGNVFFAKELAFTHSFEVPDVYGEASFKQTFWSQDAYDALIQVTRNPGNNPTSAELARISRSIGYQITLNGDFSKDVSADCVDFNLRERRNMPTTATIRLVDEPTNADGSIKGDYKPSGGAYSNAFDGANMDQAFNIKRYWRIRSLVFGMIDESAPHLVQVDSDWQIDASTGLPIRIISLMDYSEKLLVKDQSLPDFVGINDQWTAHKVLKYIFDAYKVSYRLEFEDYRVFHFSAKGGTPLDWIKQLIWVRQAEWFWEGATFVVRSREKASGTFGWDMSDYLDITQFSYKTSIQELRNEFVVRKMEKAGTLLASAECEGGSCLGLNTVTLSPPSNNVMPRILSVVRGKLHTFSYTDANGGPLTLTPGAIYRGTLPAAQVRFIYEPVVGALNTASQWPPGIKPGFAINFTGSSFNQTDQEYDPGYLIRAKNISSQQKYGVRRNGTPIESQLIPDAAAAKYLANALLEENIRLTRVSNLSGPLQPFVRPAQSIKVTVGLAGFIQEKFYVESANKVGNASGGSMSLEISRAALSDE